MFAPFSFGDIPWSAEIINHIHQYSRLAQSCAFSRQITIPWSKYGKFAGIYFCKSRMGLKMTPLHTNINEFTLYTVCTEYVTTSVPVHVPL